MGKRLDISKELVDQHSNINFNDFIYKKNTNSKLYKGKCLRCDSDRGYIASRSRWSSLCRSCNGIKSGSINTKGKEPWNKGSISSMEQRVKQSCSHRKIDVKDFDDFLHINKKRHQFNNSGLRDQCFENADFTCDLYDVKGEELNAHHLDSWHDNEENRFKLDNLVCLSKAAHKTFHNIYGGKNSTKQQYKEFKEQIENFKQTKQALFLIIGCPASGKSWVCNQLKDKLNYVSYDNINKNYHIYELLKNNSKPLLYDPTIKVSTFIKRYSHLFNVRLIVITEDKDVIAERMLNRGGKITNTLDRRIKRMSDLSKHCEFNGTSNEVLDYFRVL